MRGEEAIDAELSRDATDAGERQAAACRAAVPSVGAKRETWETLTGGKLTIAMFRATLAGFADPDQPALVEPYRPEYFAALGKVWREWSSAMAQDFVEGGYTIGAVDEATMRPPTPTWRLRRSRRRRCAACSTRAGTRCSAPCGTRPATARPLPWSSSQGCRMAVTVAAATGTAIRIVARG